MKFGKNLLREIESSNPEFSPYWIDYKFMKKKINKIIEAQQDIKINDNGKFDSTSTEILKLPLEIEFFKLVKFELKKTSDLFSSAQELCLIRHQLFIKSVNLLKKMACDEQNAKKNLLKACVNIYKDVLLLEKFAILNYNGFSKILKKHDKSTGFSTRAAFMRNVMCSQNFTNYAPVRDLFKQLEVIFLDIQGIEWNIQIERRLSLELMAATGLCGLNVLSNLTPSEIETDSDNEDEKRGNKTNQINKRYNKSHDSVMSQLSATSNLFHGDFPDSEENEEDEKKGVEIKEEKKSKGRVISSIHIEDAFLKIDNKKRTFISMNSDNNDDS